MMHYGKPKTVHALFLLCLALGLLSGQAGCSSSDESLGTVTGKVTLNSEPVAAGMLTLISSNGFGASAEIKEGTYSITTSQLGTGIPVGEYQVSVFTSTAKSDPLAGSPTAPVADVPIPPQYGDPATSGLSAVVSQGANEVNFELKAP